MIELRVALTRRAKLAEKKMKIKAPTSTAITTRLIKNLFKYKLIFCFLVLLFLRALIFSSAIQVCLNKQM